MEKKHRFFTNSAFAKLFINNNETTLKMSITCGPRDRTLMSHLVLEERLQLRSYYIEVGCPSTTWEYGPCWALWSWNCEPTNLPPSVRWAQDYTKSNLLGLDLKAVADLWSKIFSWYSICTSSTFHYSSSFFSLSMASVWTVGIQFIKKRLEHLIRTI